MGAWISWSWPPGSWNSSRMMWVRPKPRSQSPAVSPAMPPPRIRASVVAADILPGSGRSRAAALRFRHEERALLHAAHLEAEMPRADRNLDRGGLEVALDRVGHRLREALLQSRHAGKLAHQPRDGSDPTDAVARRVRYRGRSEVGNEVVRAHSVHGDALEPDHLARRALVARGAKGTGLAPEGRRAFGEEIGGELRRDRVLRIPARIDPHRAQERGQRGDGLGTCGCPAPRIRGGLPVRADFLLEEILVLVDHGLVNAPFALVGYLVFPGSLGLDTRLGPAARDVLASAAPVRSPVAGTTPAAGRRRFGTRLLGRRLSLVLRVVLGISMSIARWILGGRLRTGWSGPAPASSTPASSRAHSPSSFASACRAESTNATCSSRGTPSSRAPSSISSRFTDRAKLFDFILRNTESGVTSASVFPGCTSAVAVIIPQSSSEAKSAFAIGVERGVPV